MQQQNAAEKRVFSSASSSGMTTPTERHEEAGMPLGQERELGVTSGAGISATG
jgi:hypothetical protein